MQEIDESFIYTTLFLLRINLLFGNKKKLSLIEALEGRRVLEYGLRDDEVCFLEIDEAEEFMKFLEECGDIVYYKDGYIYLRPGITVHNIDEKISQIKHFKYLDYSVNIFKYLNILKPIELIHKYYQFEKVIEDLYMNNDNGKNNKEIEALFKEKKMMLQNIRIKDDDYIECITTLQDEIYESLESKYILYPININRYEKSDHYDAQVVMEDLINSPFQSAIFTDFPLYRTRVRYDFNKVSDTIEEEYINDISDYEKDATEEYYDDTIDCDYPEESDDYDIYETYRIEDAFPDGIGASVNLSRKEAIMSLYYIKILKSMKNNKNISCDIDKIIKRLEYIIDDNDIKLYQSNYDIESVISKYMEDDDVDYIIYADEVMYFIDEIFNTYYDRFYFNKLVFIKAYYDITNDNEVINYINEFKGNRLYKEIYEFVTGHEIGKIKRR